MQQVINSVMAALDGRQVPLPLRGKIIAFSLARAMGYDLALPTSSVDSPALYFNTTHRPQLELVLSAVNEIVVFDIGEVEELAYKVWLARYRLVHEMTSVKAALLLDILVADGNGQIAPIYLDSVKFDEGRALRDVTSAFGQSLKNAKVI